MAEALAMSGFQPLEKSKAEWKKLLPAEQYAILFEASTERSFSSPLNGEKRAGNFICAACFLPLFSSEAKFESGTGWPSFFDVLPGAIGTRKDTRLFITRTEYHCARCGGHHCWASRPRRGDVADLLPDHAARLMDLLHRDDARRAAVRRA